MVEREEANESGRWPINSRITRRNTYEYAGLIAPLCNCQGPESVAFQKTVGRPKASGARTRAPWKRRRNSRERTFFHSIVSRAAFLRRRAEKTPGRALAKRSVQSQNRFHSISRRFGTRTGAG